MATSIKLDGGALAKLLADSPEFKLELQRAVVAEVVRNSFRKDLPEALLKVIDGLLEKEKLELVAALKDESAIANYLKAAMATLVTRAKGAFGSGGAVIVSPETKLLIDKEVASQVKETIDNSIVRNSNEVIEALGATIDERIERRANRLLEEEINRRVKIRFDAMLKAATGS